MIRPSIVDASASGSLSRCSASVRSTWYASCSPALRASASSRRRCASPACDSASEIIRSTSSSERPEPPSIRICCSLPVPRSFADTLMIPFASMSNETSICGIPRVAGGIPTSWNFPSVLLNVDHLRLALRDVDLDRRLVVLGRRERLRLARRDGRVALDELREHAALRLDAERERGHVEQEDVLDVSLEHAGLDRGADGDDLVRVDALVRVLADELLHLRLHRGHAGHAADEDDVLDVGRREARVRQRLLRRPDGALEQVVRQLVELRARELEVEVLRALGRRGDERQVDLRRHRRGQLDLRLLARLVEALQRHRVLPEVDALVALELRDHPVDDRLVEVVAAEVVVAVRRLDVVDAVAELEHGDVERPAAEVEDEDRVLGPFLVEAVRECGRGRLVDDAQDVEPGDLAGVLRRLALRVVEVGRDRDDGIGHGLAEVRLGVRLELLEDHRRDLRRRELRALGLDAGVVVRPLHDLVGDDLHLLRDLVVLAAHEPLDREDRVLGIRDLLALRGRADEPLAVTPEGDDGRCRAPALGVRDDGGLGSLEDGHARVRRPEVDADGLGHVSISFLSRRVMRKPESSP